MGISSSLPQTAAVKMIDIWMIFTMMYPFTGVMLQSYLQVTRGTSFDFHKNVIIIPFSISTNQTTRQLSNLEGPKTRAGERKIVSRTEIMQKCRHRDDHLLKVKSLLCTSSIQWISRYLILNTLCYSLKHFRDRKERWINIALNYVLPFTGLTFTAGFMLFGFFNHYTYTSQCDELSPI